MADPSPGPSRMPTLEKSPGLWLVSVGGGSLRESPELAEDLRVSFLEPQQESIAYDTVDESSVHVLLNWTFIEVKLNALSLADNRNLGPSAHP